MDGAGFPLSSEIRITNKAMAPLRASRVRFAESIKDDLGVSFTTRNPATHFSGRERVRRDGEGNFNLSLCAKSIVGLANGSC